MQTPFEMVDDLVAPELDAGNYEEARRIVTQHADELGDEDTDYFRKAILNRQWSPKVEA